LEKLSFAGPKSFHFHIGFTSTPLRC
jgi:hypothetical protein